jgi:transcriptional regulator with XRE-family HTH domain
MLAGLQRKHISALELGAKQPTITTVFKVANGLAIPASKLIALVERALQDNTGLDS